ncbi:MAG TPA: AsmA family protein [Usitatibacter sp.]|nr:AsmA family protein [Usitatibacter sp.]
MTTWRRVAMGGALALAAAAAALAIAVHALVDPAHLKSLARDKARAAWSRDLEAGDVSLRLFPVPSIDARDVSLSVRDGPEPFVHAKHIDARLELLALLAGKPRLKSLDVEDASVTLAPRVDVPDVSPETTHRASATPQLLDLTDLRLANVDIVAGPADRRVTWHVDEATFSADKGWRDADIDAKLSRNGQPLRVKAKVADLSRIGSPGATSDGEVELAWKQTRVALKGQLPLDHGGAQARVHVDLESPSLGDVFAFYALERRQSAPVAAHFDANGSGGRMEVSNLQLALGKAHGHGSFTLSGDSPRRFKGRISIDQLDWAQAMIDAGTPPPVKRDTGLAFNPDALAWPLLEKLDRRQGTLDADVGSLKLRNGVELRNARFHFAFEGDRLDVDPVQAQLLGGQATATLRFDGAKKTVAVAFDGSSLLLERWFHERGRAVPFSGGPMNVHARFTSSGNTMRDLAASATGQATLRMGPGAWNSPRAGDREALMTNAFASEGAQKIQFECVTANLPFRAGVARGRSMVGFKTEASELITSGVVNLRDESVDLHGRVHAHKGVTLGLANIAGDVKIGGHLTKLQMSLDPADTPGVIARAGAAIATLGVSVIGSALIEKMDPDRADPCERPVRKKGDAEAGR